ncbi:hypothetical protein ACSFC1_03275 [Pseudothermotoga sp. U03pept]|uniref:hypothetical protein n=1 Tax=Pseudothermotoga sp. U03pept TaxID=3447012 RepID=UPI003F052529
MQDVLREIANACKQDRRIFEIVQAVAAMTPEEKESFESKVKAYFLSRTEDVDLQAYEFYTLILNDSNAQRVLEIVSSNEMCV